MRGKLSIAIVAALTATACGQVNAVDVAQVAARQESAPVVVSVGNPDPDARRALIRDGDGLTNCAKVKCVALTFDDGPMPDTARLLRILDKYQAKATFFVVGAMVKEHPDLVRDEVAAGHEIANHSWDHSDLARMSESGVRSQLQRTNDIVQQTAGVTPTLLRPPYGSTDAQVSAVAKSMGMPQIMWAVDPLDWKDRDAGTVSRRVLSETRRGDVVLMHDIHPSTVTAVPAILEGLAGRGFHFVTVTELFHGAKFQPGRQFTERRAAQKAA
ncbi:polysaccharide deacetylase family protein [Actinocorallia lasiicapitis]